VARHTY